MSPDSGIAAACQAIAARVPDLPRVAVVLGSGLGGFSSRVSRPLSIPCGEIPHWPVPAVPGHEGRLVVGDVAGCRVAVLAGRVHFYEGFDLRAVTFPTRALAALGVKTLVLTNAAGGVNAGFGPGTLMAIDDHLNLMGGNPLIGPNDDVAGPRFPDMSEVYAARLRATADAVAAGLGIDLRHGVYAAVQGPCYETPAEIRYLRAIGADAVGMSTVPEAIAARHAGVDVLGISCIANLASGLRPGHLDHGQVLEAAGRLQGRLTALVEGILARL